MRSPIFAAILGISCVSACGGSGYGGYDDDDQDEQTDKVEARDGGAWDARTKDAGKTGGSDGGGTGSGNSGNDDDSDDGDDDDDVSADAGVGADAGASSGGGAVDCTTLTYQTFGKQFLSNYCVGCHGSSGGVSLGSLANVVKFKAGVKAQVTSGGMPLGGKQPSDDEREQLGAWIDCGPK